MPRYVILAHDWPAPHFDLLLEAGGVLKSWRLAADPRGGRPVAAEANADHRLSYLDTEGEVSGGRGSVRRVDAGTYEGELGETWAVRWNGACVARMGRGVDGGLVFECGLRNADCEVEDETPRPDGVLSSIPQSAFRNPHSS